MVKRSDQLFRDKVKSLMGGEGELSRVHFMSNDEFLGAGRLFCRFSIKEGDSIGYHKHEGEQEAYYILAGKALFNDNGVETILNSGDFALCTPGNSHSIQNIGDTDLDFIALILFA